MGCWWGVGGAFRWVLGGAFMWGFRVFSLLFENWENAILKNNVLNGFEMGGVDGNKITLLV